MGYVRDNAQAIAQTATSNLAVGMAKHILVYIHSKHYAKRYRSKLY